MLLQFRELLEAWPYPLEIQGFQGIGQEL